MTNNLNTSIFIVFMFALLLNKIFWFLPFVLIVPVIITFVLLNPLLYLGVLAILLEFFSTSIPGIMAVSVFLPWLIIGVFKRFYKEVKIDFLISFYLLVGLIIFSQLILINISDSWKVPVESQTYLRQVLLTVPWLKSLLMVAASTFVAATTSIFIKFNTSWQ